MLTPATNWLAWNTAPPLLLSLAAMVLVYAWGMYRGGSKGRERRETFGPAFGIPASDEAGLQVALATPSLRSRSTPEAKRKGPPNGPMQPRPIMTHPAHLPQASVAQRRGWEVPERAEGVGRRRLHGQPGLSDSRLRAILYFAGAVVVLVIALVSPLDALGDSLFTAHMIQHLLLMLVAAPLLVLSEYPLALLRALPRAWSQRLVRGVNRSGALRRAWDVLNIPEVAWVIFTIEMWAWHSSSLYQAALRNETIHSLEHIGFVLSGMLFWWVLFKRTTAQHTHYGMAILYLFAASVQSGILGALMMFTSVPWYGFYASRVGAWGLTPLQDQQLAGLIMWIPGGAVFNVLTIGYFAAWWRALEERGKRQHSAFSPVANAPGSPLRSDGQLSATDESTASAPDTVQAMREPAAAEEPEAR